MAKSGYNVKINVKGQLRKLERAWSHVNERVLPENFSAELLDEKWPWPGQTVRSSGAVVGSPRNVYDTGELFDSYYRRKDGPTRYVHGWSAPHALPTHEGAQLRNGGTIYPRPWTEAPVRFIPQEFAKAYKAQ
jgi:hypothetical protein